MRRQGYGSGKPGRTLKQQPHRQRAVSLRSPGSGCKRKPELEAGISDAGNRTFFCWGALFADIGPKQGICVNAEPGVKNLGEGTALPGIDDILTPFYLFVEEPAIHFDLKSGAGPDSQLLRVISGERVAISGTTNMGMENPLHADIRNLETDSLLSSVTIPVIAGTVKNCWASGLDTTGFYPEDIISRSAG